MPDFNQYALSYRAKTFVKTYFDITTIECVINHKTEGATGSASVLSKTTLLNIALAKPVAPFNDGFLSVRSEYPHQSCCAQNRRQQQEIGEPAAKLRAPRTQTDFRTDSCAEGSSQQQSSRER